uniref:Late blight resistance protein, putative n=1 Tax=Solanum demissum TaxID=50514 RepID=Q6L3M6_SOLDE|nr:Late blight resistance protein, putative [Solanum demissum]
MIEIWKELIWMSMYVEKVRVALDAFVYWKEVIWKTKQEFRAQYSFPKSPLAANKVIDDDDNTHCPEFVMQVIDVFVGNINVLVKINDPSSWFFVPGHMKEQIEQLLKELNIQPQHRCTTFYTHALIEASHIAMVVWLHLPVYGNLNQDLAPSEVSRLLSDFMEMKIKSIQPGNSIYIDVLQALKSTIPQAQKKHEAESCIVEISNFCPENEEALLENSPELSGLESLSSPFFARVEDAELMLRKTPNLRKLICKVQCLEYPHQYHVLNFPIRLKILKLYRLKAFKTIPFYIFAPNLKFLELSGFYLNSQYLSETADHLKHLEVLKLYRVEFGDHGEWKVSSGKFPKLKILKLEYVSLMKWIVADDAFPNLEQLVLRGCRYLMEIPSCFMDILSLQYIKVENCNESVVKSAMTIQEIQVEDYQNTNFKLVLIKVHY